MRVPGRNGIRHSCYNGYGSTLKGKVDVDIFLTMNVRADQYKDMYTDKMKATFGPLSLMNGEVSIHPCFDTLQVQDYQKYEMGMFDEAHKHAVREWQFPMDLEAAFQVGAGGGD